MHISSGSGAGGVGAPLHHIVGGAFLLPSLVLLRGTPHHPPLLHLHDNCACRPQPALHVQQEVRMIHYGILVQLPVMQKRNDD